MARRSEPGIADGRWIARTRTRSRTAGGARFAACTAPLGSQDCSSSSSTIRLAWLARAHTRLPLLLSRRIGFPLQKNAVSQARYRAVNRFVANSKDVAQSLMDSGIAAGRISIVNEGVEVFPLRTPEQRSSARRHWGVRESEFLLGCVSVFVPEKGQRHVIEALALVRALHPEVRLLLAGDGACRAELQALTKHLGQTEAVLFPGFVTEVAQVYAALDAFVFPSEFEGLGTALQVAMGAGLPCISTKRGALGEVVDHKRTALVAEPDSKELAAMMLRLIDDKGLRKNLSDAGRREVEQRFSAGRMVENTIHVYEDVLQKKTNCIKPLKQAVIQGAGYGAESP